MEGKGNLFLLGRIQLVFLLKNPGLGERKQKDDLAAKDPLHFLSFKKTVVLLKQSYI